MKTLKNLKQKGDFVIFSKKNGETESGIVDQVSTSQNGIIYFIKNSKQDIISVVEHKMIVE